MTYNILNACHPSLRTFFLLYIYGDHTHHIGLHYGIIVQYSNSHILFERNLEQINPGKRHIPKKKRKKRTTKLYTKSLQIPLRDIRTRNTFGNVEP